MSQTTAEPVDAETVHQILDAADWRLRRGRKTNVINPGMALDFWPMLKDRYGVMGVFDLDLLQVEIVESEHVSEREYRRKQKAFDNTKRYLRLPDLELDSPVDQLRQYVDERVTGPDRDVVVDAVCSSRPFRRFKEVASIEVYHGWFAIEYFARRRAFYDFLVDAGVSVEAVCKGDREQ